MPVDMSIKPTSGSMINPGGVRQLTLGEIALACTLYGNSIIYSKVWVHRESYLPFNMQPISIAMTPNGEMWYREGTYSNDFSLESNIEKKHRFMHEMMHVWQAQKGMFVRTRGLFSRFADYSYSFDKADILHYSLEQQASLVSDYWLLLTYGYSRNTSYLFENRDYDPNESVHELLRKYKSVMKGFPG
ncbi:type IV secretion protein Rhs [Citrobacter amalonaticus]|uniref:Type IV secretion protein Rhs n=1 Tax=Citrobacter amalonaticus TaxID=35703 RepID=A0A2S4S129_CITAM|nr:type IV secretion protein Rhs [Citrobacter amalonaticus]POT55273.1 type IV secretion protein Rhs [Citrobacter amalonaticus]POT77119.1 type IV secretion protein Rhs [Citrobacter amalonaticus]POU67570.1 type IV secretion protein Rhs [Citrobacter amalonaticus]POV07175.1 type IV secretion protein Rhs [Citrobacter amalonaticus]